MKLNHFSVLLLFILAMLMVCTVANSDVIWEPNDEFYKNKYEDCEYIGRSYTAKSADGSVTVWKEPGSRKEVDTIKNGSALYVSFKYTDKSGATWGVVQFEYDDAGNVKAAYTNNAHTGWIMMAELALVYDYRSFNEEHESEYQPYSGDYKAFMNGDEIVFWSYPRSGVITRTESNIDENFSISYTYTDSERRQWGFISYYYGIRNSWVCISDPISKTIPAIAIKNSPAASPSQTIPYPNSNVMPENSKFPVTILLAVLVFVLIITTVVIIHLFWKK